MKIKRGKYKGRNIEGYNIEGTRPTMDRVKESLFAILQNHIKGSTILDLFAGTGALGWEALSIGASKCYFNDHNPICTNIIKKTKEKLQAEEVDIKTLDYQKALSYYQENNITFDIIFLDPPYQANILNDALENIQNKNLLRENGFVICEKEKETTTISYPIYKEKKYGKKTIIIYQKKES